jgi:Bacterial regulatory protein, arsR family
MPFGNGLAASPATLTGYSPCIDATESHFTGKEGDQEPGNIRTSRELNNADLEKMAGQFRLLGEAMRLKILKAICAKPLTVGEIVAATGATQSNISKHLALLASAGIIKP